MLSKEFGIAMDWALAPGQPNTPPALSLGVLSISDLSWAADAPAGSTLGAITGKTDASLITLDEPTGKIVLNGGQTAILRGLTAWEPGDLEFDLIETKDGYLLSPRTNSFTGVIESLAPTAPTIVGDPVITGPTVETQTLTISNGTWTGSPSSFAYAWRVDGVVVSGATDNTFELDETHIGSMIDGSVVATGAGGSSIARFAAAVGPITELAYDYIIDNDGDASTPNSFLNIMALGAVALNGAVIGVFSPVTGDPWYTKKTFGSVAPGVLGAGSVLGQTVTFVAAEESVEIDRIRFNSGCLTFKTFDGFTLVSRQVPMIEAIIHRETEQGGFEIKNSPRMSGNIDGDPYFAFDPTDVEESPGVFRNRYAELGHVRAIVNGSGTITGGTIMNKYIGSNWGDHSTDTGTAEIVIITNGVTKSAGLPGTTASTDWTLTIVAGIITAVNVGSSGGTSYGTSAANMSTALETIFDIDGRVTFQDKLHFAHQSSGTSTQRVYFRNNYVTLLRSGYRYSDPLATVEHCWFDAIGGDTLQTDAGPGGKQIIWRFNFFSRPWLRGSDYGQPHSDIMQVAATTATVDTPVWIEGNVAIGGLTRGYTQGVLISDSNNVGTSAYTGRVSNNLICANGVNSVFAFSRVRNMIISYNTAIRYDIADSDNIGTTAVIIITEAAYESVIILNNVAELVAVPPPTVKLEGNVNVTALDSAAYTANFEAPHSLPTTRLGAIAAFQTKGPSEGKGASRTGTDVDWVAGTVSYANERAYAYLQISLDQPLSTAITSAASMIVGGPATGPYTVTGSGFSVEFADNAAFSVGVVDGGTSGTYTSGKYQRMKKTTGAVNNTTETGILTLNGATQSWSVTTTSLATIVGIDNQGTAWSLMMGLSTLTGRTRMMMSMDVRVDTLLANRWFAGRTASNDYFAHLSGGIFQPALSSGGGPSARSASALPAGQWVRVTVLWQASGRYEILFNTTKMGLTNLSLGTAMSLAGIFNSAPGFGLFATNTGTAILDGRMKYFYFHAWTGDDTVLPATTTEADIAAIYNSFSPDNIDLADGSGPLGVVPIGFFVMDDVAAANGAGIPNRGSGAAVSFVKQAGTYVAA